MNCDIIYIMQKVDLPRELLWDYREPPEDILWRLQRIAVFFPAYGTERENVNLLYEYRDRLRLDEGKYKLIGIYKKVWDEKTGSGN